MITEVQITCIVLMGLMAFILAFMLPHYTSNNKAIHSASRLLTWGTILLIVHFIIQYASHKTTIVTPDVRTLINFLFGIPIGFCFNLSLLYLQRDGKITTFEWSVIPILYIVALLIMTGTYVFFKGATDAMHIGNIIVSLIYAFTLIYANILQLKSYFFQRNWLQSHRNNEYSLLIKWTQWSMLIMMFTGLGLPVFAFNENLTVRSFYGLFSISSAFFYIFSFIGYALNCSFNDLTARSSGNSKSGNTLVSKKKNEQIEEKLEQLTEAHFHLQAGITIQDLANEIGVSRNALNSYFQTTPYQKFNHWLLSMRLEEAKKLLLEHPDWTNETIASECGFGNRAYFQSQFSEQEGISPSKWIKQHQQTTKQATEA